MSEVLRERENDDETIETCPFCLVGGATLAVYSESMGSRADQRLYYVGCDNCGAEGIHTYAAEPAIVRWNTVARRALSGTPR